MKTENSIFYSKSKLIGGKKSLGHICPELVNNKMCSPIIIHSDKTNRYVKKIIKSFSNTGVENIVTYYSNQSIEQEAQNIFNLYEKGYFDLIIVYGGDEVVATAKIALSLILNRTDNIQKALDNSKNNDKPFFTKINKNIPFFVISDGTFNRYSYSNIVLYNNKKYISDFFFPVAVIIDYEVFKPVKNSFIDIYAKYILAKSRYISDTAENNIITKTFALTAEKDISSILLDKNGRLKRETIENSNFIYQTALLNSVNIDSEQEIDNISRKIFYGEKK